MEAKSSFFPWRQILSSSFFQRCRLHDEVLPDGKKVTSEKAVHVSSRRGKNDEWKVVKFAVYTMKFYTTGKTWREKNDRVAEALEQNFRIITEFYG